MGIEIGGVEKTGLGILSKASDTWTLTHLQNGAKKGGLTIRMNGNEIESSSFGLIQDHAGAFRGEMSGSTESFVRGIIQENLTGTIINQAEDENPSLTEGERETISNSTKLSDSEWEAIWKALKQEAYSRTGANDHADGYINIDLID